MPAGFPSIPGTKLNEEPKGRKSIAAWLLPAHLGD
jgi:hypothetical protein